jgi:hypothetical protein
MKSIFLKDAYAYVISLMWVRWTRYWSGGWNGAILSEWKIFVGMASQLSIGFQAGGQAYSEVIFLIKRNWNGLKTCFWVCCSSSAVAVTEGASADVKYTEGVMVFHNARRSYVWSLLADRNLSLIVCNRIWNTNVPWY